MAIVMPNGKNSYETSTGSPLSGGKVYTYAAGTTTPKTTWSDAGETSANTNPIILDARGEATIFWNGNYKVVLKDASDVTIWTIDNFNADIAAGRATSATVETFAAIASTSFPSSIKQVTTLGFSAVGWGEGTYSRWTGSALASWGSGVWWTTAGDGSVWQLDTDQPRVSQFGGVADGSRPYLTITATGTDNLTAFSKGIAWVYINQKKALYTDPGSFYVSNTIQLGGLGTGGASVFHAVSLIGISPFMWGGVGSWDGQRFPGTYILTNNADRPCIAISSGRSVAVTDIVVDGPCYPYIINNSLGIFTGAGPAFDDTAASSWVNNAAHTIGRYNTGFAIAIDPYSGTKPGAGAYPDPVFPSYYAGAAGWGQPVTSIVHIEGGGVYGMAGALGLSPGSDTSSQGDYLRIKDWRFQACVYGVSIGTNQSRNVELKNVGFAFCHTVLATNIHGNLQGRFGGEIVSLEGGASIQLFSYSSGTGGGLIFDNFYAEGLWRLGDATGSTGAGIVFRNAQIGFDAAGYIAARGLPLNHYGLSATSTSVTATPLEMTGETEIATERGFVALANNFSFSGAATVLSRASAALTKPLAMAHNATSGGFAIAGAYQTRVGNVSIAPTRWFQYNVSTGNGTGYSSFDGRRELDPKRINGTSFYAQEMATPNYRRRVFRHIPNPGYLLSVGGAITSITRAARILTITFAVGWENNRNLANFCPGDVLIHSSGVRLDIYSFNIRS